VAISILLLHHREDVYPQPFAFRPERWAGHKPGTYEWIPFGGGTRRCLGAALAMAEQRVVLEAMARRLDLEAADPEPEHALHRNVSMIPAHGARVVARTPPIAQRSAPGRVRAWPSATAASCSASGRKDASGPTTFELVEEDVPEAGEGEALVRTEWISLDPTNRAWINDTPTYLPPVGIGDVMRAAGLGRVVTSNHGSTRRASSSRG
jgi:hypothetical protein